MNDTLVNDLPKSEFENIFKIGINFRRIELQKKRDYLNKKIIELQNKYKCNYDTFEKEIISSLEASLDVHEDYVFWKHILNELNDVENILKLL